MRHLLVPILIFTFLIPTTFASECDSPDPDWYFCSDWTGGGYQDGGKWGRHVTSGDTVELTTNPPAEGPGENALEIHWRAYGSSDASNYVDIEPLSSIGITNPFYTRLYFYSGDPREYPGTGGRKFMLYRDGCGSGVSLYLYSAPGTQRNARLHIKNHAAGDCTPYNTFECEHFDGTYPWPGQESDGVINANQWYSIEFSTYRHNSLGWVRAWLDGKLVIDATGTSSNPLDTDEGCAPTWLQVVGYRNGGSPSDHYEYVDNVIFSDVYIGPIGSAPQPCADGSTQSCSTGQQGICSAGTETCTSGTWGSCIPDNSPTTELCTDSLDNDCDGLRDCQDTTDCSADPSCQVPETCQSLNYECCDSCQSGSQQSYDDDCPGQVCCSDCTQPTQTCSTLGGTDCCTGAETCPGSTFSGASDCSGICCSTTCQTGGQTYPIITVDSTYSGYTTDPIDDGVIDAQGMESTTWASGQSDDPHWIEFDFGSDQDFSGLTVHWAYNPNLQAFMSSEVVEVQAWDGSSFSTIDTIANSESVESTSVGFSTTTSRLRLYQQSRSGYSLYPDILWLTEVNFISTGGSSPIHPADTMDPIGCVDENELIAYIALWKQNSTTYPMRVMMQAVDLYFSGTGCS